MRQALDEDQEGPTVLIKKLFEEDREFNQGAASCPLLSCHSPFLNRCSASGKH